MRSRRLYWRRRPGDGDKDHGDDMDNGDDQGDDDQGDDDQGDDDQGDDMDDGDDDGDHHGNPMDAGTNTQLHPMAASAPAEAAAQPPTLELTRVNPLRKLVLYGPVLTTTPNADSSVPYSTLQGHHSWCPCSILSG